MRLFLLVLLSVPHLSCCLPLLSSPVFSLSTVGPSIPTMNILTYASPVGITPNRLWAISIYKKTQSWKNWQETQAGTLQLLSPGHASVVPCLGGLSSASDLTKSLLCGKLGFPWSQRGTLPPILPRCPSYISISQVGEAIDAGDHEVVICKVLDSWGDGGDHLTTGELRKLGLITEKGRVSEAELEKCRNSSR